MVNKKLYLLFSLDMPFSERKIYCLNKLIRVMINV